MQDKEFAAILQNDPMQPLALVPLTEEEQVGITLFFFLLPFVCSKQPLGSAESCPAGCFLAFLTFLPPLCAEELLHVCEQCGGAEAHGKRCWRGLPRWSGPWTRGHTGRTR